VEKKEDFATLNPRYSSASFILRQTNDGFKQVFKDSVKQTPHEDGFFNGAEEEDARAKTGLGGMG